MATEQPDREPATAPPGHWPRVYLTVAVLAIVMMFLLWALSAAFNIRLPRA